MSFSGFRIRCHIFILIFLCLLSVCHEAYAAITVSPSEVTIDLKGRQQERFSEWSIKYDSVTTNKASFDFYSSNSRVADVQGDNIIGLKEGVAYITVSMTGVPDFGTITVKVVDSHKDPSILQTPTVKPIKSDIITNIPSLTTPRPVTTVPVTVISSTPIPRTTVVSTPVPRTTAMVTVAPKTTVVPVTTKIVITTPNIVTNAPTTNKTISPTVTKSPTKVPTTKIVKTKVPTKVSTPVPTPVPTPEPTPTPIPVSADFRGIRVIDNDNQQISLTVTEKSVIECETWYDANILNDQQYSYYSLSEKVAKVSNTGVITGVSEGNTFIYVFAPTNMNIGVEQAKKDIKKDGSISKRIEIK